MTDDETTFEQIPVEALSTLPDGTPVRVIARGGRVQIDGRLRGNYRGPGAKVGEQILTSVAEAFVIHGPFSPAPAEKVVPTEDEVLACFRADLGVMGLARGVTVSEIATQILGFDPARGAPEAGYAEGRSADGWRRLYFDIPALQRVLARLEEHRVVQNIDMRKTKLVYAHRRARSGWVLTSALNQARTAKAKSRQTSREKAARDEAARIVAARYQAEWDAETQLILDREPHTSKA